MAYSEDYLELIVNVEDAIRALLAESTDESWIGLRDGLREIRLAISIEDTRDRLRRGREEFVERRAARKEKLIADLNALKRRPEADEYLEAEKAWHPMPIASKERIVIESLGDDRLPVRELAARVNKTMGGKGGPALYRAGVELVLRRLVACGEVDRVKARAGRRGVIWHYFRRRELDGPIAELERAFQDDDGAVA